MDPVLYWSGAHDKYAGAGWIDKPTIFVQQISGFLPPKGKVLDLGGGQGQDARFFAERGYEVTLTDFSEKALKIARGKLADVLRSIRIKLLDFRSLFPFKDSEFNVVYSHLALHYFDDATTRQIFSEMLRVLKPGGVLAILVNSVSDPEYNPSLVNNGLIETEGIQKRFFDINSIREFARGFEPILLDNQGETYKDRRKGVFNLIRFVGKKPLK